MSNKIFNILLLFFIYQKGYSQAPTIKETTFAIRNVNVITMTSPNKVLRNATVVIRNAHIETVNGTVPNNAVIIEGKGKWLIPGLVDMHVHLPTDFSVAKKLPTQAPDIQFNTQDVMTPFIANGVTTIFNLNANTESFSQRKEVERGSVIGPRMTLAALINGGDGSGRIANTAEAGRQAVRDAQVEGYEFIKVYSHLNTETYTGFHEPFESDPSIDPEDGYQGWCDECEKVRFQEGEWNDVSEGFAKIRLVCEHCFFEMKQRNTGLQ